MANVPCDQCSQQIDPGNTGTICTPCLQSVMQAAGFKGLVQATSAQRKTVLQPALPARPLLLGKATLVSNDYIDVEFDVKVRVRVDVTTSAIDNAALIADTATPTGRFFDVQGQEVVAPASPPKFNSPEEADAWLEANPIRTGVVVPAEHIATAEQAVNGIDLLNWV